MNAAMKLPSLSKRGVAVIIIALLGIGAVGLGTVEGAKKGKALTPKAAKKQFFTKKAANAKFLDKPRYLDVPAGGMEGDADANYQFGNGGASGWGMPDPASSVIGIPWTMPAHYPAGAALTVAVTWTIGANACSVFVVPNSLAVHNAGATPFGSQADVGQSTPAPLAAPGGINTVSTVTYTIPGTIDGQQIRPGTTVLYSLFRNPANAGDTCATSAFIKNAHVSW
jgi:hypothetical protein